MSGTAPCWMINDSVNRQPVVVLNGCDRDAQMEIKKLQWIHELGGCKLFDCLIVLDAGMNRLIAQQLIAAAEVVFHTVKVWKYATPANGGWPLAANWAFQQAAYTMMEDGRAWFWHESDCIPLKEGWMEALAEEYWSCGKPMMGSIVAGRGHLNGTAIYPPDFPDISPTAMKSTVVAWDWEMRAETIHLSHDSKLMAHVWGIEDGRPSPYTGTPASFQTQRHVDLWVPKEAVTFHRAKDGTLIDRLRERKNNLPPVYERGGGAVLKS